MCVFVFWRHFTSFTSCPSVHELMSNEQLSQAHDDASAKVSTEVAVPQLMDKYKFDLSTLKASLTGTNDPCSLQRISPKSRRKGHE